MNGEEKLNSTLTLSRNAKLKWKVTDTNLEGIHVRVLHQLDMDFVK